MIKTDGWHENACYCVKLANYSCPVRSAIAEVWISECLAAKRDADSRKKAQEFEDQLKQEIPLAWDQQMQATLEPRLANFQWTIEVIAAARASRNRNYRAGMHDAFFKQTRALKRERSDSIDSAYIYIYIYGANYSYGENSSSLMQQFDSQLAHGKFVRSK